MAYEKTNSEQENTKIEWNLNKYKINLIGGLMEKSIYHSLKGNHFNNFTCWRHISILIKNRLSQEQKEELINLQNKISKCISFTPKKNKKYIFKKEFPFMVEDYIDYLNGLLKKIGLDLEDSTDKGFFG